MATGTTRLYAWAAEEKVAVMMLRWGLAGQGSRAVDDVQGQEEDGGLGGTSDLLSRDGEGDSVPGEACWRA
jgi:hypothetical protein